ncbi:hypothetical protein RB596_006678 [Gaeumannomyces avenae]
MEGSARSPGPGPQAQAQPLLPQTQQEQRHAQSPPPQQPDYSTLEVAPDTHASSTPQVYYESAPEPVSAGTAGFYAPNKAPYGLSSDQSPSVIGQASPNPNAKSADGGLYPVQAEHDIGTPAEEPKKTVTMSKKKMWIIGAVVLFLIIAAAVGGGVGGTLAARNSSNSGNGTGGGDSGGNGGGGGGSSPQPNTNTTGIALGSPAMAAVNYTVGTTDYRMVFWQPRNDSSNLVYSLWDSSAQTDGWKVISVNSKLADSKAVEALPGTPIAAAVRPRLGQNQRHAVSVFFLSASNVVQELRTTDPRGASWSKVTHPVTAARASQLAAHWDVCETSACSGLVALNYETEDHKSAWLWPGLTDSSSQTVKNATTKIVVDIIPGSGIALTSAMDPDLNNTAQQNIKLYYQDSASQTLKEVSREFSSRYVITQTKLVTNMTVDKPTQLYATSFYKDSAARFLFVLLRAADGTVQAMHWNSNTWRQPIEPVFRNTPADVGKSFAAVSVTNDLKIYALSRDGNSFHTFNADKNDPVTWTYDTAVKLG